MQRKMKKFRVLQRDEEKIGKPQQNRGLDNGEFEAVEVWNSPGFWVYEVSVGGVSMFSLIFKLQMVSSKLLPSPPWRRWERWRGGGSIPGEIELPEEEISDIGEDEGESEDWGKDLIGRGEVSR